MDLYQGIESAVSSARKLALKYKSKNSGVFDRPIKITRKKADGWSQPSSPTGLVDAASSLIGKSIKIQEFPKPVGTAGNVASMLWCNSGSPTIFVSKDPNFCWQRYFVAKELSHLIQGAMDHTTRCSVPNEIASLIGDLLVEQRPESSDLYILESAAYYGAVELLLPKEFESGILDSLKLGRSTLDIAQDYKVPRSIVESRYTQLGVLSIFDKVYKSYQYQHAEFKDVLF